MGIKLFSTIDKLDYAFIQSFATYVAFDRVRTTYGNPELKETFINIFQEYIKVLKLEFLNNENDTVENTQNAKDLSAENKHIEE